MADKKTFNCCKEHGDIGKREESVLRSNIPNLESRIDPTKMVSPLFSVGILTSTESRAVRNAERADAIVCILEYVLESGPDAFMKFMDALRKADYGHLAADLEQQLRKTPSIPIENRSQNIELQVQNNDVSREVAMSGNGMLQQLVAASVSGLTSRLLQSYGLAAPAPPVLGITVRYGRQRRGDDIASTLDVNGSLNITTAMLEVCMRR